MNRIADTAIMRYIAGVLILALVSSCATSSLWKATDPGEFVRISMDDISEDELKEKELRYYKDPDHNAYYVEKTGIEKLRDYSLRLLATPFTVVMDAASIVIFVFYESYKPLSREECRKDESCAEIEVEHRRAVETATEPSQEKFRFPD